MMFDEDSMPVNCSDCGRVLDLNECHFIYEPGQTTSDRGVCRECYAKHEEEAGDDE